MIKLISCMPDNWIKEYFLKKEKAMSDKLDDQRALDEADVGELDEDYDNYGDIDDEDDDDIDTDNDSE